MTTTLVFPQNDDYPYRAIVYITATFPDGKQFSGSGAIVGINDVLTASHLLFRIEDGGSAVSVTVYPGYNNAVATFGAYVGANWSSYKVDLDGDGLLTAQESQYDVGIIGFASRIGEKLGQFGLDPNGASGYYNLTGYPGKYLGPGGAQMTNDFGYATVNANYHVFSYGSIESNPGNSGGPLWYDSASGPYVVGVASTSSWAANVGLTYSQIVTWIQGNDNLIPAPSNVAVSSTAVRDPAVIVYDQMYGYRPTGAQLDGLHTFQQGQHDYAVSIGVPNPTLYVYEAFGQALSHGPAFVSQYSPGALSDVTFATTAWLDIFDHGPTPELIKFVTDHVDFYEAEYLASGAFGSDPNNIELLARGATYGLIMGSAEQAGIAVNSTDDPGISLIGVSEVPHLAYAFAGGVLG
jgi:V8-like Glu-specific endopeptidase